LAREARVSVATGVFSWPEVGLILHLAAWNQLLEAEVEEVYEVPLCVLVYCFPQRLA
jgi:hypothetical protein